MYICGGGRLRSQVMVNLMQILTIHKNSRMMLIISKNGNKSI